MMIIFIDSDSDFENVAAQVYRSLGINEYLQGNSDNVYRGIYNSFSVFGMIIKLEPNSYDYEDDYKFMIQVKKDVLSSLKGLSNIKKLFADLVLELLTKNLNMKIAVEKENKLIIIK